jgi:hypothetical protein
MWDSISVKRPGFKNPVRLYINTNNNIIDIPVIISGLSIGKFVTLIKIFLKIFLVFTMPTAAKVPRIVATAEATMAMIRVLENADNISVLFINLIYHLKVKPCQTTLLFELLKEYIINIAIGEYKKRKKRN